MLDQLLKVNKKNTKEDAGIVYVLEIDLDEEGKYVKIGLTTKVKDPQFRWHQILDSIWKAYRFYPKMIPKRFTKTSDISKKEKILLDYFSEYQQGPKKKVDGHTECHKIDLEFVVEAYDLLIKERKELPSSEERCKHCGREKKFTINEKASCAYNCEEELNERD